MSDLDPRQAGMDSLLRQLLTAPIPRLSQDFPERLSRELRRRSKPPSRFSRVLLTGYGGLSAVVSIVVMRGQGLGWLAIAATTLGPLATLELARRLRRRGA